MKKVERLPERTMDECGDGERAAALWLPIASAPTDGTKFLAYQRGEVWRAYGAINPRTGKPYYVRRTHERKDGRTYRQMEVEVDGVWGSRRVLMSEEPDDYEFQWVLWSRGFDFEPTHWTPFPVASGAAESSPRQVTRASSRADISSSIQTLSPADRGGQLG